MSVELRGLGLPILDCAEHLYASPRLSVEEEEVLPPTRVVTPEPDIEMSPAAPSIFERAIISRFAHPHPEFYNSLYNRVYSAKGVLCASLKPHPDINAFRALYFPPAFSELTYLKSVLETGQVIQEQDDRSLWHVPSHDFWFEAVKQNNKIQTVNPLFYVARWESGKEYQIAKGYDAISSKDLLLSAQQGLKTYKKNKRTMENPVRYTDNSGDLYIDLAKRIFDKEIAHVGIIIIFNSDLFVD